MDDQDKEVGNPQDEEACNVVTENKIMALVKV